MNEALAAGEAAGEPDALVWYGAQLFGRWVFEERWDDIIGLSRAMIAPTSMRPARRAWRWHVSSRGGRATRAS